MFSVIEPAALVFFVQTSLAYFEILLNTYGTLYYSGYKNEVIILPTVKFSFMMRFINYELYTEENEPTTN